MDFKLTLVLILVSCISLSIQKKDDGNPPVLTIDTLNVDLKQYEGARSQLGGGTAISCEDQDGDQIRAYIESISPNSGCGLDCLQLEPCSASNKREYCLWFLPSQGSLQYLSETTYTLSVACTDDFEPTVRDDLIVNIITNTAPVFNPTSDTHSIRPTKTTHNERFKIYKAAATDADGDPMIYTMSTSPHTDLLEIEQRSGQIRAAHDLKMLCEESIDVSVFARDPYNTASGPFALDLQLTGYNQRPTINGLDTTVYIDENQSVDKRVLQFDVVDSVLTDHTYNLRSLTSAGLEAYTVRAPSLRTKLELDYEREDTRSVKLYFDIDDGYCRSETYSLTVEVNDVAEKPKYTHTEMLIMTDEGNINEPNNVFIIDDDLNEAHTHEERSGTDSRFFVDPATGNIVSYNEVLLNPGVKFKDFRVRMRVVDKDGLASSQYEAKVRLFDINDHRPYFTNANNPLKVSAHECLPPGSVLGSLTGADDDSEYNHNNWVYFGGGGAKFGIAANGWIVLSEQCINGETYKGTATIADQGINPGPLTGDDMEVIIICGPCPAAGDGSGADGTSGNSTMLDNLASGSSFSATLWEAPAVLLFAIWLGLTAALVSRFCRNPCKDACQPRPKTIRVTPEPPPRPTPQRPGYVPPKPRPPPPSVPPRGNQPVPQRPAPTPSEPYLFGFWQETFTDQSQFSHPNRRSKPRAIEDIPVGAGNQEPPPNLRLGPPGSERTMPRFLARNAPVEPPISQPPPPPEKKKKICTIL